MLNPDLEIQCFSAVGAVAHKNSLSQTRRMVGPMGFEPMTIPRMEASLTFYRL